MDVWRLTDTVDFWLAADETFLLVGEVTTYGNGLSVRIGGRAVKPLENTVELERSLSDGSTFACRVRGQRSALSNVVRLALVTVTDVASDEVLFSGNIRRLKTHTVSVGAFDQLIDIDLVADGIEQQLYRRVLTSAQAQELNRAQEPADQAALLAEYAGDAYYVGTVGSDVPRLIGALGGDTVGALLRQLGDVQKVTPDGEIEVSMRSSLSATATADLIHVTRTSSYSGDLATTASRVIAQGADTRFVQTVVMRSDGTVLSATVDADENRVVIDVSKVVALGTIYGAITSGEELPVTWSTSDQSITLGLETPEGSQLLCQVFGVWRLEIVREREGGEDALSGDVVVGVPSSIEADVAAVAERELARQQYPVETLALDMILGSGLARLDVGDAVKVDIQLQHELDVYQPAEDDLWLVERLRITQPAAAQAAWAAWLARREPDYRTRDFWSRERSRTQADQNIVSATNYIPAPEIAAAIPVQRITIALDGVVDLTEYFRAAEGVRLTYTTEVDNVLTVSASVDEETSVLVLDGLALGNTDVRITATNGARTAVQVVTVHVVASLTPRIRADLPDVQMERNGFLDLQLPAYFYDPDGDSLTYAVGVQTTTSGTASLSGASTLYLQPGTPGEMTVTVTATDPSGLAVSQSMTVTVVETGGGSTTVLPNQNPILHTAIPAQRLGVGDTRTVVLGSHFSDPDRDALTYTAASSDAAKVSASIARDRLAIRGVAVGNATITVTASDGNLTVQGTVAVTVVAAGAVNRKPVVTRAIPSVTGQANLSRRISNLTEYFSDPDDDDLTFTATSSNTSVVRAAVSSGHLDLTGRGSGNATVTVTASDGTLSVAQQVSVSLAQVTIPNRKPVVAQSIADQNITAGTTKSIPLARYFSDPDDDNLSYTATSSATGKATATVASGNLSLRGVAAGSATVTVRASDGTLDVSQTFTVTVAAIAPSNRAPRASRTLPARSLRVGNSFSINLANYFSDPDGNDLTFAANSDDTDRASAGVSGSTLTVRAIAAGGADITVTADDGNLSVTQVFTLTVTTNSAPSLDRAISNQTLNTSQARVVDLTNHFSDPDGDDLTFTASSSATGKATVAVAGSTLTISAGAIGSSTITVTASDGDLTTRTTFSVTVQSGVVVTTDTDSIYRRGTTAPGRPSGGTGSENHLPSGWSRTNPGATVSQGLYRSTRTRTYNDGSFASASAWSAVALIETVSVTSATETIYRLASTKPAAPDSVNSEGHVPTGWRSSQPDPTATLNVYSSSRTSFYYNDIYNNSGSWSDPTEVGSVTVTTSTDSIYRRSASAPATPSGGTATENHTPTSWTRTQPQATAGNPVYRSQRTRTYHDGVFQSATAWGAPSVVASITVSTDTDSIYRRSGTEPFTPTGGEASESHLPSGWSRTQPAATAALNVYEATRTRTYHDGVFESATAWGGVTEIATLTVTTDTDSIYIRSASAPDRPTGNTGENSLPSGWSRTKPSATTTQSVYRSRRNRTYENGAFASATAWSVPVEVTAKIVSTTDTDSIYIRSASAPSTPSGGTNDEDHLPTNWSRTQPSATTTQAVYRSRRTRTYNGGVFASASAWSAPVQVAGKVSVTTDTDRIYRRASSTPTRPTGGTSDEDHLPSGWSRSNPGATSSQAVYRSTRTRTYNGGVFASAGAWGSVSVHESVRLTTDTDSIYRRAASTPGTPSGGTNDEDHLPTSWSRTNPGATTTQAVYRSTRTRSYAGSAFTSATSWGTPTLFAAKEVARNNAPVLTRSFPNITMYRNIAETLFTLSQYFTDPDGDDLTYTETAGPTGISSHVRSGKLVVTPGTQGFKTVTVRASDGQDHVETTFKVKVVALLAALGAPRNVGLQDAGRTGFQQRMRFSCKAVSGATQYEWEFQFREDSRSAWRTTAEETTSGVSGHITLFRDTGEATRVRVRANRGNRNQIKGAWSSYSSSVTAR